MPLLLAIENSNPSAASHASDAARSAPGVCVASFDPGATGLTNTLGLTILSLEPLRHVDRGRDDLIPAIDRACRRASVRPTDLNLVAVSVGPGGYTAVRSACSAGKMIAEGVGARTVSVPSALVAALGAHEAGHRGALMVMLAGKDDSSHATAFEPCADWRGLAASAREVGLVRASTLASLPAATVIADRFLPAAIREHAIAVGWRIIEPEFRADRCARIALLLERSSPESLNPLYPREPDAITLWRARGPQK